MRFLLACGGSGGHVFPAVAAALALRRAGHDATLLLCGVSAAGARPAGWDGAALSLPCPRPATLRGAAGFAAALPRSIAAIRRFRPDAMLATGSYACVPAALAARSLGVPLVLHEANAVPGAAIGFLACFSACVCLAFGSCAAHFPKRVKTVLTGLPLRDGALAGGRVEICGGAFRLLVMGGSQGARGMGLALAAAVKILDARGAPPLRVTHLAGVKNEAEIRAAYAGLARATAEVIGFSNGMGRLYAEADFCVTRSGASSCFELCANGVPSLHIPLPKLARDHQACNAREMERLGCAQVMPQAEAAPEKLAAFLAEIIGDKARLRAMSAAALRAAPVSAAEKLADEMAEAASARVAGS